MIGTHKRTSKAISNAGKDVFLEEVMSYLRLKGEVTVNRWKEKKEWALQWGKVFPDRRSRMCWCQEGWDHLGWREGSRGLKTGNSFSPLGLVWRLVESSRQRSSRKGLAKLVDQTLRDQNECQEGKVPPCWLSSSSISCYRLYRAHISGNKQ